MVYHFLISKKALHQICALILVLLEKFVLVICQLQLGSLLNAAVTRNFKIQLEIIQIIVLYKNAYNKIILIYYKKCA